MWKLAKTSAQKIAIIKQQVPISARDWNSAIIAFSGDEDYFVSDDAQNHLSDIPHNQLIKLITEELMHTSAQALLSFANSTGVSSIITKLVELRKITDTDFLGTVSMQSEQFWGPLVTHKDFVTLMARTRDEFTEKIAFSASLLFRFNEQFAYITEEQIELYHRDINTLKLEKVEPEKTSFEEDDDMIVIIDDDEGEVIEFTDEFSDFSEEDSEESIVSFDDATSAFFFDDAAFVNLSREEQTEKREKIQITIAKMNIGEKTKLAMTGNLEIRKILIKDPIKLIAKAVLNNNGITAKEIALIASSAATSIDLISYIANTKSLNKYYQVKMALVTNPKLPIKMGMRLLEVIRSADLKKISKSRGVSQTLKQRALRKLK
ncbi:hypothetical protein KAH37_01370 [bacterium]|nr:hypothetical protein [bacterium]